MITGMMTEISCDSAGRRGLIDSQDPITAELLIDIMQKNVTVDRNTRDVFNSDMKDKLGRIHR
jgi:hypothetical protein